MTKDKALDLALEALELHGKQYPHMVKGYCLDALTAIKQALALDKMAENARELGLDYEPVREDWGPGPHEVHSLPPAAPVQDNDAHYKGVVEGVQKLFDNKRAQQAPVQEPVVFYRCNGCGHAYEQVHPTSCDCMEAGGFDRVEYYTTPPAAQPAPVEPFEYWNAVEGWVKIDEVREHFDSVGCGTIYKTSGDGRVPLTAAQRQWVGLTDEERDDLLDNYITAEGRARAIEAKLKEKNT
jgi:hypothetical protein